MPDAIRCQCPACKGFLWLEPGVAKHCPHCGKCVKVASSAKDISKKTLDGFWQQEFQDMLEEFIGTTFEASIRRFARQKGIDLE